VSMRTDAAVIDPEGIYNVVMC